MRSNSVNFNEFNQASLKSLRLVVKINYATPLYLTSHSGIPSIPANRIDDCLRDVSSTSQRLAPDEGRSEIGSISFSVVDISGNVTNEFRTNQDGGEGLTGLTVELYRGGDGMDWTDFRLEQTQQIDRVVSYDRGAYKIQCSDLQRSMRKDIFDVAKTRLSADFNAGDATLNVYNTDDFEACTHTASFGDQTTGSFYYLKIRYQNGFEIVRATGKTATTFTGCVRGMFGTSDVTHTFPTGENADSSIVVEEYVYLELPAPAMAYALLTGDIIGGGTIPARWHLGIAAANVDQPSFEDIGEDWFDSADYSKGLIFRFQGVGKTDGKRFIEREVCLLAGAFLRVGADGKLYMRRMTGVIGSADYVAEVGVDNAITHSEIRHELNRVRNTYDVTWSYIDLPTEKKPIFVRRDILSDATSIALHGESKPLSLAFKGLHNERHTYTTLINRFDALRDRYAGPPITLRVDLLPTMNDLEVGDIVRVVFPNIRDYSGSGTLDRAFEIQRITINQKTGRVSADLFGSTLKADPIPDSGAGVNAELPDGWYSDTGTEFSTAGLTINGSGVLTANGTLTGGTTTRTVFYYLGDFTINAGVTLTVTGNVELRVRGHFQNNGTLRASGGQASNTAGFIGTTYGGPGIFVGPGGEPYPPNGATVVNGVNSAMPVLEIENNAGSLAGIPADMLGSGGGIGGSVWYQELGPPWLEDAPGGAGGAGGGSVVTVSRGFGYGVSGVTDVSGDDGAAGSNSISTTPVYGAGSGGGGAPGCLLHLLDGSGVTFPILSGNVNASYGTSPITNSEDRTQGKAKASDPVDLGVSNARVAYVPASRDPYPEYENDNLGPVNGISTTLTNASHVVSTASDGTGYSLTNAGGTHQVTEGATDVTASATHSVVAPATVNGLTMSVTSAGVYSLSAPSDSWTTDAESFTLRAVYGGVTFDKTYSIAKAKSGSGGGTPRITAIGASATDVDATSAEAAYRVSSDGDCYKREGTAGAWVSVGTWLGTGTNADYDIKFSLDSGDAPTSGEALDTWLATTANRDVVLTETVEAGFGKISNLTVTWRDDTTFEVLGSASVDLNADRDSGA